MILLRSTPTKTGATSCSHFLVPQRVQGRGKTNSSEVKLAECPSNICFTNLSASRVLNSRITMDGIEPIAPRSTANITQTSHKHHTLAPVRRCNRECVASFPSNNPTNLNQQSQANVLFIQDTETNFLCNEINLGSWEMYHHHPWVVPPSVVHRHTSFSRPKLRIDPIWEVPKPGFVVQVAQKKEIDCSSGVDSVDLILL